MSHTLNSNGKKFRVTPKATVAQCPSLCKCATGWRLCKQDLIPTVCFNQQVPTSQIGSSTDLSTPHTHHTWAD